MVKVFWKLFSRHVIENIWYFKFAILFKVFTIEVEEDFLDYVTDGSLAIEVYGNRSRGFDQKPSSLNATKETNEEGKSVDRYKILLPKLLF